MKHRWLLGGIVVALAISIFASCSLTSDSRSNQSLSGRMLLWHSLRESEAEALNQVIISFTQLNPNASVKVQGFESATALREQFLASAAAGLGPDLILAPSSWVQPLATAQAITPIDARLTDDVIARFNPSIIGMLQIDGQTYGLPQSLDTMALYVNRTLVETPVNTLNGLLQQANAGITVLLPINFIDAFWGIQAFGGQLFNDDGQLILDQGGFANWLAWLRDARNAPGMIQDTFRDALRQRFMAGNGGYYLGYASELNDILTTLDAATITVLPLPNGPVGSAGPFVSSQAFLFSTVSSRNQRILATEFAKFVTNVEQSARMMRMAHHIPANTQVRINPRLNPIVAAFTGQARNAVPMPTRAEFDAVVRLGNEAYVRALEGGQSPAEVAFSVNNTINEANGFELQTEPSYTCTSLGTIRLVNTWQDAKAAGALEQIITNFRNICPLIIIEPVPAADDGLATQFATAESNSFRPTFALVDQTELPQLLNPDELVKNLTSVVDTNMLQRFIPIGVEAMHSEGNLYGLPLALQVDALYYNRQLVTNSAQTLDDLRTQAVSGLPITLDTRFEQAFWGIGAFGGSVLAENGAALVAEGGMAEWLTWLLESREHYNIQLSNNEEELRASFLNGMSAYYVADSDQLSSLREALGDNLGVALLPSGPAGPAQPLVHAQGFVIRQGVTEAQQNLALEFMRFATDVSSQTLLMNEADKIPVNTTVSMEADSFFAIFVEQAQSGFLLPNVSFWQPVAELGQRAYADVLENGLDPTAVVAELATEINEANGVPPAEPTVVPTPPPTLAPEPASTEDGKAEDAPAEGTPAEDEEALPEDETAKPDSVDEGAATPTQNSQTGQSSSTSP